jgi:hypothetical protein
MQGSLLIVLLALALAPACESKREIPKQMNMTNVRDGKTQTCVDGDEATCTRAGGRWSDSMSQCCLARSSCVLGDAAACARVKGTWTGKYCCVAAE